MASAVTTHEIKVYGYRWVVLLCFVFCGFMTQVFWICYAPISNVAAQTLGVSDFQIGLLAMMFMYIFIPMSLPASWFIDTWGFKKAVGLGAILLAFFGMMRGIFALNYTLTLLATIGLAIAQPFFLNAGTKLAASWFRFEERATIVGLGGIAVILGIVVGEIATPYMLEAWDLRNTMLIYGIFGVISALIFIVFARDHPPTPAGHEERALVLDGLKHIVTIRDFYLLAFIAFVVNAIFNGIATWVNGFVIPKGMDINQAGLIGGLLLIGGIVGFLIFPFTSDHLHKRRPVIMVGCLLSIPFLVLLTRVSGFLPLAIVSFLLGICDMGIWPVIMQYSTEISYPAPEGTSVGMINIAGQLSVFAVTTMGLSNESLGSFTPSLLAFAVAMAIAVIFVWFMKESKLIQASQQTGKTKVES